MQKSQPLFSKRRKPLVGSMHAIRVLRCRKSCGEASIAPEGHRNGCSLTFGVRELEEMTKAMPEYKQ